MPRTVHNEVLTIKNGGTTSDALGARVPAGQPHAAGQMSMSAMIDMDVFTPAFTETIQMQVAPNENPAAADWKLFQWQPGTDMLLTPSRCISIPFPAGFRTMRFVSTTAVVADRVFVVVISVDAEYGVG